MPGSDSQLCARRERVLALFAERRLDALLVSSPANVRYLAGFTGSNGLLLLAPRRAFLFTDGRYTLQASQESDCEVVIAAGALVKSAVQAIRRGRFRRVGIESNHLKVEAWQFLSRHLPLGVSLDGTSGLIERVRMVKEPGEIERIRRAVLLNSRVYEQVLKKIKPGVRESDVAAELEFRMRRIGADGPSFDSIVAFGAHSALPHAHPTAAKLENDQLVLIDMGASLGGYASDMTRTIFFGKASRRGAQLYRAVLKAQLAAIEVVRAGVAAEKVDRAARSVLDSEKLGHTFVHSTGHGLGLEIHEPPRVGKREKTRLEAGMVITIEPGAYLEGFGGVRIEDTVLVTETGCEVLTPTSKELTVL